MHKTILVTGATDGIGLETAKMLFAKGHHVLIHGRNSAKLNDVEKTLSSLSGDGTVEKFTADLSRMQDVQLLADSVIAKHAKLDVLINNAGVFKSANAVTEDGLDTRFAVNTIAPYLLTQRLLPLMSGTGRIINLSSAAQATINLDALAGNTALADMDAYAQSKLAITMWSMELARKKNAPVVIAVNPGSMLGSKMVKEGFGVDGGELRIGADILCRTSLDDEFASASGQYFDNDSGQIAPPHADALNADLSAATVQAIEAVISRIT